MAPLMASHKASRNPDLGGSSSRSGTLGDYGPDGLDLEWPRDIRILIAQSEHVTMPEVLLFDSKPSQPSDSPRVKHARTFSRSDSTTNAAPGNRLARNTQVPSIPENLGHRRTSSSYSTGPGAFQRRALRRGSVSSTHSLDETSQQNRGREGDEIEKIALGVMFENATSSYKGASTKIHIIPLASKPYDNTICSTSLTNDFATLALTKSAGTRRPSLLSKSHIPGDLQLDTGMQYTEPEGGMRSQSRRRTVLVTRTFSINWVDDEAPVEDPKSPSIRSPGLRGGFGFDSQSTTRPNPTSFTRRSLMYAITIVLQLPIAPSEASPPSSRPGTFGRKAGRKHSSSHQSYASLGSSFDSDRRAAWSGAADALFASHDSIASASFNSDVDDRVDLIGQHWDIISRTLTTLQYLVQKKIFDLLKPLPRLRRSLKLPPMALAADEDIKAAANSACIRVIRGMKIPRVRTGHGRWPAWREEARWLSNWAGGREENFFFLILMTGFLGTHTEWLSSLAPKWYRKRYREQQRQQPTTDMAVPNRTIIVSADKMAARRLIFLLSAFLPGNHKVRGDASPLRPSTSASFRGYSQSPPGHLPLSRQESLRRTINRRNNPVISRTRQQTSRASSIAAPSESHDDWTETGTIRPQGSETRSRRTSDAKSMMPSKLSISEVDPSSQKSTTTISSTTPSSVVVKPYFTRQPSFGASNVSGHSRTSSAASANLMFPLQRTNSSGSDSQWGNRWGSLRNLWGISSRRGSTVEYPDVLQTTDEGLGIMGARLVEEPNKLQQMVDEGHGRDETLGHARKPSDADQSAVLSPDLRDSSPELLPVEPQDASNPIDIMPLNMSVDPATGFIDVKFSFPEFGSPLLSPGPGEHSGSSYGESSIGQHSLLSMTPKEHEHPLNVGGWLDKLHPDFTLQAVKPHEDTMKDVKAAMSAEPNPTRAALRGDLDQAAQWLDICTSLVADTSNYTVKRLRLRRLVKFVRQPSQTVVTPNIHGAPQRSQYGNPYSQPQLLPTPAVTEITLEEKFEEDRIMDMDGTFVDMLERILAVSGSPSKTQSASSSRSSSCRGRREGEESADASDVPRDCKKVITGTLEQIVSTVARERASDNPPPKTLRSLESNGDSTLREGIRKWFDEVEANSGNDMAPRKEAIKEATEPAQWASAAKERTRSEGSHTVTDLRGSGSKPQPNQSGVSTAA